MRDLGKVADDPIYLAVGGEILGVIPPVLDPCVDAALHIAGEGITDDDAFLFFAGDGGKDCIEKANVRFFKAQLFGDKDAV